MSAITAAEPALLDPTELADQRAGDSRFYRDALHRLIDAGVDLAESVHRRATAAQPAPSEAEPAPAAAPDLVKLAAAFDRLARAVRGSVDLARKLAEPDRAGRAASAGDRRRRPDACQRTIRAVAEASRRQPAAADPGAPPNDAVSTGGRASPSISGQIDALFRELGLVERALAKLPAPPGATGPARGAGPPVA